MTDAQNRAKHVHTVRACGLRPVTPREGRPSLTRRSFLAASAVGAASLLGALALPGCSPSRNIVVDAPPAESDIDTKLTFFGFKYEPLNVTAIETTLRRYMDEHPNVSISYEGIKSRPYYAALDKRLSTGNGDDIFMVDHDTSLVYAEKGYLADLSDLPTISTFGELALSQMRASGTVRYVPTSISAFGLFCNLALLKERGLAVPRTLSEFERACDVFVEEGMVPVVANNDISLKTLVIARGMASVYQAESIGEAVRPFVDDPAALAAQLRPGLDVVERLIARGYVDAAEALQTEKTADDLDLFAAGDRPFMLTGAWAAVRVRDMAPDLDFEVYPYPILDEGSTLVVNVDTRVSVNANSPDVEAAKEFVAAFTRPEAIELFANSQCSFSPLAASFQPEEQSVAPLADAFKERAVIGSDDNINLPVWGATRKTVVALLEGATAEEAEAQLLKHLSGEEDGA